MRLSQLAKSLDIQVSDIIAFLKSKDIVPKSEHPNAKLDEAYEQLVMEHFGDEQETGADEYVPNIVTKEADGLLEEVIKAPKVELPGLKVVGKIELPEKKEKESKEEEPASEDQSSEEPIQDGIQTIRHSKKNSRKRLTPEEREARRIRNRKAKEKRLEKERKRKEEAEKEAIRKKKEAHYKKKIAQKKALQNNKKSQKSKPSQKEKPSTDRPKSLMGRFWKWLNT